MTAFANIDGVSVIEAIVHVPSSGPWFADLVFEGEPDISGTVVLRLGDLELTGTIDPTHNGTFGAQRKARMVAGAGAWATLLPAKSYHNDANIRARSIAEDAAREAGETLGDFSPQLERIGIDYVRQAGLASRVLEDVIGSANWWVDYTGRTNVGQRTVVDAAPGTYEVLEFSPGDRVVVLAVDDLGSIGVGTTITERLDTPRTIRDLEIRVEADAVRVVAWCGGDVASRGRLPALLRSVVAKATDGRLFGLWKYRVVRMHSEDQDRVELQAVRRDAGLPDLGPTSLFPGIAGAHARLTPGAEVLVQFVEGDRRLPLVTHFAGVDGTGWAPVQLILDASSLIKLGADAANAVALANLVQDELTKIKDAFAAAQVVVPVGGGSTVPVTFLPPTAAYVTVGDVGAEKVVAE